MLRSSLARASSSSVSSLLSRPALPAFRAIPSCVNVMQQNQIRKSHAISNPTLADIEKRWESMPPQEQADLWMLLRDRMKVNWTEMTLQEKKAAYWIAFGPHGPRALQPAGEGFKIFTYVLVGVGVAMGLFWVIHTEGSGHPRTMNKEWQEMTNEYLKGQKVEPISGLSSAGYSGAGQVQSPPLKDS